MYGSLNSEHYATIKFIFIVIKLLISCGCWKFADLKIQKQTLKKKKTFLRLNF